MSDTNSGESFIDWLVPNLQSIKDGSAVFDGQRVTLESFIVQYEMCYSIIFFSSKNRTPFFLMGTAPQKRSLVVSTLLSLLFGWWGLPWGLLWTPAILASNICGGLKMTVGQLIAHLEDPTGTALPGPGFARGLGMWALGLVGSGVLLMGISHVVALFAIAGH